MNRIATTAIAATLALTGNVPAQAGVNVGVVISNDHGHYDRDGYRVNVERIAFDNGYRDGIREGEKDMRHHDRFEYRDEGRYRSGDSGYHYEYGPRYAYVSAYRRGFADGYRHGYASYRRDWRDDRPYDR